MARINREKFKTYEGVFDNFTLNNLFKLSAQGYFEELQSPIKVGKEANVFSAKTNDGLVVVKIYRLETCDFNRMYEYMKQDTRYVNIKKNRRDVIFAWAQREFRNLLKARKGLVNVPMPITFKYNILVMEMIGAPAKQLKDDHPKDPQRFFEDLIKEVEKLLRADLVHGDLSAFNILNYKDKPVIIDISQSITLDSPNAKDYLYRDIRNIVNFFNTKLNMNIDYDKVIHRLIKVIKNKNE